MDKAIIIGVFLILIGIIMVSIVLSQSMKCIESADIQKTCFFLPYDTLKIGVLFIIVGIGIGIIIIKLTMVLLVE